MIRAVRALYSVEFDLESGVIRYREGAWCVTLAVAWREGWQVDPASARWWSYGESREAVTPEDRAGIVARVVAAAKSERRIDLAVAPPPEPGRDTDPTDVLAWIEQALAYIGPLARHPDFDAAQSIERQLRWCRGTLRGEPVEAAPGPLTMGFRATREFDHFGSNPEFAALINRIEDAMTGLAPRESDD